MNLLRKYYDGLADLPTGGGIPDEVRRKIEEKYPLTGNSFNDVFMLDLQKDALWGYSLASEEISRLKESLSASERFRVMDAANAIDDQISQRDGMRMQINSLEDALMIKNSEVDALKEENERLRGEVNKLKTDNDNLGRHLPYRI